MSEGPELVIGLVGAIGTDLASVSQSLQRHLSSVGYASTEIRVSALLHDLAPFAHLGSIQDQEKYYDEHMNAGNDLCQRLKRSDAMALLAVLQLRTWREERNDAEGVDPSEPLRRHAFVVNSLKRKDEITALRRTYGDGFILLGAYAGRARRLETLTQRIATSKNQEARDCRDIAERLMARDEAERHDFGQDVSHTFFRADAFIDATERANADDAVRRFVEVVFGHPFATPTREELGMRDATCLQRRAPVGGSVATGWSGDHDR